MQTLKIIGLAGCTLLLWACTTSFNTDTDADDVTTETGGDADATSDVDPDTSPDVPTDEPGDVPTDTLPPEVECRFERSGDFLFPTGYGGTNIEVGCWSSGSDYGCRQAGIWVQKMGSRIVVVYGGEQIIMGGTARAAADVIELTDLDLMGTTAAPSDFGMAYSNRMSDATLVRRAQDEIILLYTVDERESGLDRESNLEVVVFDSLSGGDLDVTMNRLLTNPVHESVGDLVMPSAVMSPTTGRAHIFFGIRVDDGSGWETVQIWGNYMNPGGLRTGSFGYYTDFEPVVGDYSQMMLSSRPDCIDEIVVLPWTEASLSPPLLNSGAVVIDTGTTSLGYDNPFVASFVTARPYISSIAGIWREPGLYAAAALSTSALTMVGMNPPYDVVSAVADATAITTSVEGVTVHSVDEPFISEIENFDFNDAIIVHQQDSPVHFFVHPFFHSADGGTGHVWIFPLRDDGSLAGEPFTLVMDHQFPPAFDATMDPDTGHIFLAWMHQTADVSDLERVPGYTLAEVVCE